MIIDELVGFSLLMCSNAKRSGLFTNILTEVKDLVKDAALIKSNHIPLSNKKWLLKIFPLIVSCKYYNKY